MPQLLHFLTCCNKNCEFSSMSLSCYGIPRQTNLKLMKLRITELTDSAIRCLVVCIKQFQVLNNLSV